jgi:NTE family protein
MPPAAQTAARTLSVEDLPRPYADAAIIRALKACPAFGDLPPHTLSKLAGMVALRRISRSETLARCGEPADSLFLVASGKFFVFIDAEGTPVAELSIGEPLGEIAFLTGQPRTATVIAARDSEVLEIMRASYDAMVDLAPGLQQLLLMRLAHRMAKVAPAARPLHRRPARTIGLLSVGSTPIPEMLVRRLAEALAGLGKTELLRPETLSGDSAAARLRRLEQECDFIICPIASYSERNQALHYCDSVLLMGRLNDEPAQRTILSGLERRANRLFPKGNCNLILWRDRGSQPVSGTADWLEGRTVDMHHHIALDQPADIARLARFVAGRALGAVFGGGGALGCGHIGVARAFRDAGVTFDLYGGTSAGAAMALALAAGRSPEEVMGRTEEIFVRKRALGRYTLPVFSLLDHTVLDRQLATHYGGIDIRDLPVNGYAVSTNLTRNTLQVHRTGLVWHAVRSSGAIPGALPPFVDERGDVLADGALLDNLPVRTMRELKLGPNMLAGFFSEDGRRGPLCYTAVPDRFQLILDLVMRRRRRFPRLLSVIERSMLVTSRRSFEDTKLADDLLLKLPSLPGMRILDWAKGRAQEELCYRYVTELIDAAGSADALIKAAAAQQRS